MGFEPTVLLNTSVFKTDTINHSVTQPKWGRKDSNLRRITPTDLQSVTFNRSVTAPKKKGFKKRDWKIKMNIFLNWYLDLDLDLEVDLDLNLGRTGIRTRDQQVKSLLL